MNQQKIGAVVVALNDRIVGMFTERDVLTRVVGQRDPAQTLIEDVMTIDVAFCRPDTDVDQVAATMRTRRIRHLPVCDDEGRLLGLVSIGDVNAFYSDGQEAEIHYLHEYIHGRV
jgi:CBS domain-containing protein